MVHIKKKKENQCVRCRASKGEGGQEKVGGEGAPDHGPEATGKSSSFCSVTRRHWRVLSKVVIGSDLCC